MMVDELIKYYKSIIADKILVTAKGNSVPKFDHR